MEQHTQKAWMARSLWIISEYLVFRSLQHGLTQSCWPPEAPPPPPPEATGATSLSSWPGCSRKPSLVKLWMILDEDWIVHLAGRWPATQSQECSAHIEIRSLGLTWVFFFLQGGDGNDMYEMETGFYLISKGEIFPIVSFPFFSSSTSCSSLLLLLTMAGLPTGLPECRLTRVWKRLTWRNIYKSWKSRF